VDLPERVWITPPSRAAPQGILLRMVRWGWHTTGVALGAAVVCACGNHVTVASGGAASAGNGSTTRAAATSTAVASSHAAVGATSSTAASSGVTVTSAEATTTSAQGATSNATSSSTGAPPIMSSDTCADITLGLSISSGQDFWLPPSMPGYWSSFGTSNYASQNCHPASPGAHVQVYEMLPQESGTLSITTGIDMNGNPECQPPNYDQLSCFGHVMWIVGDDCQNGPELTCVTSNQTPPDFGNTIVAPVVGGHSYYLFFSGDGPDLGLPVNGSYQLHVHLQ